jgi:hypothetical protein
MAAQSLLFELQLKVNSLNKDQVKGTLKDAAGKVQETTGKVIGSTEQQLKGIKEASRWSRAEGGR